MRRLLVSFSGGETSGYMSWWISHNWWDQYDQIVYVFANTGEENEQTLVFADRCNKTFDLNLIWIEAVQFPGERRSPSFRQVSFDSASRRGEPFEAMIAKYGIPNTKYKSCTRDLKRKPIEAFAKSLGWVQYDLAIGIRSDEMDRISAERKERRIQYPLINPHPRTKPQINSWWSQQPFRLELKGYQGNCKWCWKKSLRKHLTIISETPEFYDFPERMEQQYGLHGPEFRKQPPLPPEYRRTFFREGRTVKDFKEMAALHQFTPASDEAQVYDEELDTGGGCGESCEVFTDTDEGDENEKLD